MKVLVADDNEKIRNYLSSILEQEGFEIISAEDGMMAIKAYKQHKPDFLCLDIVMPNKTGYEVCQEIRKEDVLTPIIFISSKSDAADKVVGLDMGADDYIVKPFEISEVLARIRAITRRCLAQDNKGTNEVPDSFRLKHIEVFPKKLSCHREDNNEELDLSLREINILKLLYLHKNELINRDMLLDHCWGKHIMPESRTVDWHIAKLRKKVELDPKEPQIIKTVHGAGYKYEE